MTLSHDIAVAPAEPIAGKTRFHLVDIVKGLAIALVEYGHSTQGMQHRGWWESPAYFFSDTFVYSFHMPVFFFVAGLFLLGSLNRRGWKHFTLEKTKTILYPYLFWALVSGLSAPLFYWIHPGSVHPGYGQIPLGLLRGDADWFLLTLFICLMLAALTRRMPHWLRFALAIAAGLLYAPDNSVPILHYLPREFCFLAAGMWVGHSIHKLEALKPSLAALGFCIVMGVQAEMIHLYGVPGRYAFIPLGLMGTLGLFLLARAIEHTRTGTFFVWAGQASLGIFVLSSFCQGGVREPLARLLHVQSFWPQLILPTLAAFLIPAFIWHRQKQWKITWLFRWP